MSQLTNRLTDQYLDAMRQLGDPEVDDLVKKIYDSGDLEAVNTVIRKLTTNKKSTLTNVHPLLKEYFNDTAFLPSRFDWDQYAIAQSFFQKYDLQIMAGLIFASLPMCYAAKKGAHVLVKTYRSTHNPRRRVFESAQMVIDVFDENGLGQEGRGIRTLQKIRLLHAAIRYLLLQGDWDMEYYGMPINQEDLAATLGMFIYPVLDSLPLLGIHPEPEEEKAFIHVWHHFGSFLGIRPELNPENIDMHRSLIEKIKSRHLEESEDGQYLTETLVNMVQNELVPGAVRDIPPAMIHYLLGDELSAMVGVKVNVWANVLGSFKWAIPLISSGTTTALANQAAQILLRNLFNSLKEKEMEQKRASFSIPDHLTARWKLDDILNDIQEDQTT